MERLTERREDGTATGIKRSIGDFVGIPEMLMRLAEYEDTGMTPQEVASLGSQLQEAQAENKRERAGNEELLDKLAEAERQATLSDANYNKLREELNESNDLNKELHSFSEYCFKLANEQQAENAALRADNAALWEVTAESFQAFSVALEEARGEDWPEIRKLRDKCQQALSILHPGDSLLKELAALRTVREAAQAIISHIDTECDGECQDIAYMKLELALRNALAAVTGGKE